MSCATDIAAIVHGQNVDALTTAKIEDLLSKYAALPEDEKNNQRASYLAHVFPLLFGENAILQASDEYDSQRQVPWYGNCTPSKHICNQTNSVTQVNKLLAPAISCGHSNVSTRSRNCPCSLSFLRRLLLCSRRRPPTEPRVHQ